MGKLDFLEKGEKVELAVERSLALSLYIAFLSLVVCLAIGAVGLFFLATPLALLGILILAFFAIGGYFFLFDIGAANSSIYLTHKKIHYQQGFFKCHPSYSDIIDMHEDSGAFSSLVEKMTGAKKLVLKTKDNELTIFIIEDFEKVRLTLEKKIANSKKQN